MLPMNSRGPTAPHQPLGCIIGVLLCALAGAAIAQNPEPLPDPNIALWSGGTVRAMVRLPDGSVIVGGQFTNVFDPGLQLDIPRSNLAKFTPAGTLDLAWDVPVTGNVLLTVAPGSVNALAYDAVSGALYVGGNFTGVGGSGRTGLAKVDAASGQRDANWAPDISGCGMYSDRCVRALALDPGRRLLVGGEFISINGVFCRNLARLGPTGWPDFFSPAPIGPTLESGYVETLAVDASGTIFAGGSFTDVRGVIVNNLVKLSPAGDADAAWNPAPNDTVTALALDGNGSLVVGGGFGTIGGQPRVMIARLATGGAGAVDPTWNPSAIGLFSNSPMRDIEIDASGAVLVAGEFSAIGGQPRRFVARLSQTGAGNADPAFDPSPNGGAYALALAADASVYVGGGFERVAGQPALGLARVTGAGAFLSAGFLQRAAQVRALARAPDGSVFVGGDFVRASGAPRGGLLKLSPSGTLDPDWAPIVERVLARPEIVALAVDSTGQNVFAGGEFAAVDGLPLARLARLSATGSGAADPAWNPAPDAKVEALAFDTAGALYVGGQFGIIGGVSHRCIARLAATGTGVVDSSWNPGCATPELVTIPRVTAIALDAGFVYVGGFFREIGGASRVNVARLSATGTGSADPMWDPAPAGCSIALTTRCITQIAIDGVNGVYLAGAFTSLRTQSRSRLARVEVSGSGAADAAFSPLVNGGDVHAIALDGAGSLFAGGAFTDVQFQTFNRLAKVSAATGAPDLTWRPGANRPVFALLLDPPGGRMLVGGDATIVGGAARQQFAALPLIAEVLLRDGFE